MSDHVCRMPATEAAIADLAPAEWVPVAEWITYQLSREPLRSARGWTAHRLILGSLATELEMQAREEGEPTSMSEPERRRQWEAIDAEYARLLGRTVDAKPAIR